MSCQFFSFYLRLPLMRILLFSLNHATFPMNFCQYITIRVNKARLGNVPTSTLYKPLYAWTFLHPLSNCQTEKCRTKQLTSLSSGLWLLFLLSYAKVILSLSLSLTHTHTLTHIYEKLITLFSLCHQPHILHRFWLKIHDKSCSGIEINVPYLLVLVVCNKLELSTSNHLYQLW